MSKHHREDKEYAYWLCNLPGVGNQAIGRLLQTCGGTPKQVYEASSEVWQQVLGAKQLERMKELTGRWDLAEEYGKMEEKGIRFLSQEDEEYPGRLRDIPDAPYGIFIKGQMPREEKPAVAIIGARDCSSYGSYVAAELGSYLGERGVQIISGMARGIDGISQEAALEAGGMSFGVLGCGVDVCYPVQNRRLYDKLLVQGGILSTYPPGTEAKKQHFPPRNRIVSGLADVVVVIEARNKSGTLITVDMALEQGKDVYVVPGRITDRLSDGCNSLLKQGAGVLVSPRNFYEEIVATWEEKRGVREKRGKASEDEAKCEGESKYDKEMDMATETREAKSAYAYNCPEDLCEIYEALDFYPQSLEQLAEKLPDSYSRIQLNTSLLRLCMENAATQLSPGYFCRK